MIFQNIRLNFSDDENDTNGLRNVRENVANTSKNIPDHYLLGNMMIQTSSKPAQKRKN